MWERMSSRNIRVGIALLGYLFVSISEIHAQSFEEYKRQALSDFNNYKKQQQRDFKEYRDRVNAEFAEYMRRAWPQFDAQPAEPVPDRPEPPRPAVKDPNAGPSNDPIPFDNVIPSPDPVRPPQPVVPLPVPERPVQPSFAFEFYGTPCTVSLDAGHHFTLRNINENAVADAWTRLSSDAYLTIVAECLAWRDRLRLCDWGYMRLVECMATAFFSDSERNEARLLQMYILTQSGYKVRIARTDDRLVLLLPSEDDIYEMPYLTVDGHRYYVADPTVRQQSFHVFDREFPKEQFFSLQITTEPLLAIRPSEPRRFASERYPDVSAIVKTNRNLIDFYDEYPRIGWDLYSRSSLSAWAKEQLYPVLHRCIAGKSKSEAANMLIDFVQTAFEYKTDEEQFGYERPLFADETLYYPYSDCEDRAIFYSILVRDLLGLDVVLLHYPNHLATAVSFGEEIAGDYLMLDDRKYLVCDPTYIGAHIGNAMPQFKQIAAEVIRIN